MMQKSIEHVMIEIVAYHDPIDYHRLQRLVGERLDGEYDTERHRSALKNLKQLDMIAQPGLAHEFIHITSAGWKHIGGETSRHQEDIKVGDVPVCPVCEADELAENRW
ncbi:hypothetical protein [Natrinema sp. H-ect4]|uniref:hypothetical protein n=1 Tax=Natrinema sp. H-ect4 TaxID=3242699 RepID=UPI0035A86CC4